MAVPAGTTVTYTTDYDSNLKPSVDENIGLFAPTDTPFLASIGRSKAKQRLEEWLEDDLEAAGENAQVEGSDAVIEESRPAERMGNYTQIFKKAFGISGTLEAVDKYGRSSEVNRVSGLKTKELGRDMEWAFLNGEKSAGSSTAPRKMDGVFQFVDRTTGAFNDFGGTFAETNHLVESLFVDAMQGVWEQGGNLTTCLAPAEQKRKISAFNQNNRITYNDKADAKRVVAVVELYQSDFGVVEVIPARFIEPEKQEDVFYDRVLLYDKRVMERMTLRPIKREQLAKTGDSERYQILGEHTLKCRTRKAVGSIEKLTRQKL